MSLPNIFTEKVVNETIDRINSLKANNVALWGTMNTGQMLAHCNVMYEMVYTDIHKKPNTFMKIIFKAFIKKIVVSELPYKKNSKTAPAFIIKQPKDFELEKERLIEFLKKTQHLGENFFNQSESLNFGKLSKEEWNNMFYKHLDHHLNQFGV